MKKLLFITIFLLISTSHAVDTHKGMLKFSKTIHWETFWDSFKFDFMGCDCTPLFFQDWCQFFFCDFLPAIKEEHLEPFAGVSSSPYPLDFVGLGIQGTGKVFGVAKGVTRNSSAITNSTHTDNSKETASFRFLNLTPFPIGGLLEIIDPTESICFASGNINSTYIADLDPLYSNEGLNNLWTMVKTPSRLLDLLLPIWELRCVVDCVSSTFNLPLNFMYTCNGCRGSIGTQDTGWVKNNDPMENSEMLTYKLINNLHERGALYNTSSSPCFSPIALNIRKTQYKISLGASTFNKPFYMGKMRFLEFDGKESLRSKDAHFFWVWKKRNWCGFFERICQDNLPI